MGWPAQIAVASNAPMVGPALCWKPSGKQCTGCMELSSCDNAPKFNHTVDGNIINTETGECVDLSGGMIGSWTCGANQPNQRWSYDTVSGQILSAANGYA